MKISALFLLMGCAEATQSVDDVARTAAKSAVDEALVTRFPSVPKQSVTPFTDCVIDNATAREIGQFAKDAVLGTSEITVSLIQGILGRSETQTCVTRAGLTALGV
ncbi:MAG: hypothetical protein AB8B71_09420 [Paracoccaceae bacterium]